MIKSLEGLRGLAAVFVTLYHFGLLYSFAPIEYGYLFVDLFFVLSGFVITTVYSSRISTVSDLKPFLIRRFGRLFPLAVFSTIIFVLAFNFSVLAKHMAISAGFSELIRNQQALAYMVPSLSEVAGTALFLQGMGIFDKPTLNYASWSISVEFYAYVLFAAVWVSLAGRARRAAVALLALAGLATTAWVSINLFDCIADNDCNSVTYDFGFARCVGAFFLGAISARLSKGISWNWNKAQLISLMLAGAFFTLIGDYPALAFAFPFLCAFAVASLRGDKGFFADLMNCRLFQVLGQRSFSIYMLHPVVLLFFTPVGTAINRISSPAIGLVAAVAAIGVYLGVIVVMSGWSYARIEVPCRDWFNRLAARKLGAVSALPAPGK